MLLLAHRLDVELKKDFIRPAIQPSWTGLEFESESLAWTKCLPDRYGCAILSIFTRKELPKTYEFA